jgi:hypothetical protein
VLACGTVAGGAVAAALAAGALEGVTASGAAPTGADDDAAADDATALKEASKSRAKQGPDQISNRRRASATAIASGRATAAVTQAKRTLLNPSPHRVPGPPSQQSLSSARPFERTKSRVWPEQGKHRRLANASGPLCDKLNNRVFPPGAAKLIAGAAAVAGAGAPVNGAAPKEKDGALEVAGAAETAAPPGPPPADEAAEYATSATPQSLNSSFPCQVALPIP